MGQKIAVLILHGAGTPKENFADDLIDRISKRVAKELSIKNVEDCIVFEAVFWSSIFEPEQEELWARLNQSADLDYPRMRKFTLEFLADAVAYQPTLHGNQNYDKVHKYVAKAIHRLKERAGEKAPLCVISHSLGTIIASNYFYDLQFKRENIGEKTKWETSGNPIEMCHTLTLFYTFGSPMAMWTLRYIDFGSPIQVPSSLVTKYYPNLKGEWLNFYDKDDVLAFPLKGINDGYDQAVTADVAVNAGGILTSWNPLSHLNYESNKQVIQRISSGIVETWKKVNERRRFKLPQ